MKSRIVIDTNVFVSALRSQDGASFKLIEMIGTGRFEIVVSVPLVLEYESVAKRQRDANKLSESEIGDIIDYVCSQAIRQEIFFLWRPFLRDPADDMVLELAMASESQHIVTFNIRDFHGVEQFGVRVLTPGEYLMHIGA